MYILEDINESYTEIKSDDFEFKKRIANTLTVPAEGYKFDPRYRAGIWDGMVKFYSVLSNKNLLIPKGLVPYIEKDLIKNNIYYSYIKSSQNYNITDKELSDFIDTLDIPFKLYDYQESAVLQMIRDKRMIVRSATGSGKSLMIYVFLMYLHSKGMNSLLVVPSINLVDQMFNDFKEYNMKDSSIVKQIGGEHNKTNIKDLSEKPIVISTWQSLYNMNKDSFSVFDSIIIDEAHTAKGDALKNIIENASEAEWKIGLTGTVPKDRISKLSLLGTIGAERKVITPQQLIEKGLATPIILNILYFNYSNEDSIELTSLVKKAKKDNKQSYKAEIDYLEAHINRNKKVAKLLNILSQKGNVLGTFSHKLHGELLLSLCIQERTGYDNISLIYGVTPKPLKEAYQKWCNDPSIIFYINEPLKGDLYKKLIKNTAKIIKEDKNIHNKDVYIKAFIKSIKSLDDINIFYISGEVKGSAREYIRKNLETIDTTTMSIFIDDKEIIYKLDDKVKVDGIYKQVIELSIGDTIEEGNITNIKKHNNAIIIGGWAVVSTGVNYKNLHSIVYTSPLKSFTKIVQSIGRGMRLHKSKSEVNIYDIVDVFEEEPPNYSLKHFYERVEYYRDDGYPMIEKDIKIESDIKPIEIDMNEW